MAAEGRDQFFFKDSNTERILMLQDMGLHLGTVSGVSGLNAEHMKLGRKTRSGSREETGGQGKRKGLIKPHCIILKTHYMHARNSQAVKKNNMLFTGKQVN